MIQSESDTLTFIWAMYTYHCNKAIPISDILTNWAIDIAKPFLETSFPDRLQPDTTDPRNARLQYNEPDLMDVDDDDNRKMPATQDWQIVGAKQPKPNTPKTATTTPLPKFPPRPAPTKPGADTQTPTPNDTTTFASTSTRTEQGDKSDSLFTHVNDGTRYVEDHNEMEADQL